MKLKQGQILLIDWVDSSSDHGWLHRSECHASICRCQSVGFLVEQDENAYCLALSRAADNGFKPFCDLISIPKVAVKNIIKLDASVDLWGKRRRV
jgi:hypothetical protein